MLQSELAAKIIINKPPSVVVNTVHKFGGSSLANREGLLRAVEIIANHAQLNDLIVVSANGKTTDNLLNVIASEHQQVEFLEYLQEIKHYHIGLINSLLKDECAVQRIYDLNQDIGQIKQWQQAGILTTQTNNVLAFGEVWSAKLLAALLNQRGWVSDVIDARDTLKLESIDNISIDETLSKPLIKALNKPNQLNVFTGFIASDTDGNCHTLGRNGSDYSATIAAHLLQANNVILWTDVDGIYSADPRIVSTARKLHRLENSVAKELGRLGNPVLHAKTLQPLDSQSIQLHVASSFKAQLGNTAIGEFGDIAKQELSITHNNDLIKLSSRQLNKSVINEINRRFSAVYHCPDHSCIVVSQQFSDLTQQYLQHCNIEYTTDTVSLVAVVGYQVANRSEIKARFKRALQLSDAVSRIGFNGEHSIIAFLNEPCSVELVNHVHNQVTADCRNIGLFIAGLGNIGKRFVEMLPHQLARLYALQHVHLVGLASSKKLYIDSDGIDTTSALRDFTKKGCVYQQEELLAWLGSHPYDELIVVDITASEAFSQLYKQFFELGIHVITANKCAGSSNNDTYQALLLAQLENSARWLTNATVGAGLPINYAMQDLIDSGDTIKEVSGIFSGTLSWLFANFDGSRPFADLLQDALAQGLTEPDPRDDLSGLDVKRKLLILARQAGFTLSLNDIDCQNLVPEFARKLSLPDFFDKIDGINEFYQQQLAHASQRGGVLRYVARFRVAANGEFKANIGLEVLPSTHAFANLAPCDNIFQIISTWYQENPLIIRGPGAGRDVTAGGLHSDLVNVCKQLTLTNNSKGINS